jgi:hypothetical protein
MSVGSVSSGSNTVQLAAQLKAAQAQLKRDQKAQAAASVLASDQARITADQRAIAVASRNSNSKSATSSRPPSATPTHQAGNSDVAHTVDTYM